jgi:hypothetical protein
MRTGDAQKISHFREAARFGDNQGVEMDIWRREKLVRVVVTEC